MNNKISCNYNSLRAEKTFPTIASTDQTAWGPIMDIQDQVEGLCNTKASSDCLFATKPSTAMTDKTSKIRTKIYTPTGHLSSFCSPKNNNNKKQQNKLDYTANYIDF